MLSELRSQVFGKHRIWLLLSATCLLLSSTQVRAFVPSQYHQYHDQRTHSGTVVALFAEPHNAMDTISKEFRDMSVRDIQQRLVQKGLAFSETVDQSQQSPLQKVPGCVANVFVHATVSNHETNDMLSISIQGNADALVSRGLLAVVAQWMESATSTDQIMSIDPSRLAHQLGIASALSPGRNDGIANMVQVLQGQIQTQQAYDISSNDDTPVQKEESSTISSSSSSTKPKVALLLSGGVDSSVALRLLMRDGYDVTPFYLKIWLEDELAHLGECPWEEDVAICEEVCDQAGIQLVTLSLQAQYKQRVMDHTIHEASQGRTPNPDILCNSRIKFGCFLETLTENANTYGSFDYIASGHYAQLDVDEETSARRLIRAPDPVKDQSYFLCALTQAQLSKLMFPIGHLEKYQVRELADEFELPNRNRPDSQGLCFLGKLKFSDFLQANLGVQPGTILDALTKEKIGQHSGVWYHTVGQRKGIGRSLDPCASHRGPWYVVAKDPSLNIVYASNQYDEDAFTQSRSRFQVEDVHWIAGSPPDVEHENSNNNLDDDTDNANTESILPSYRFDMKIRHGPRLVGGTVEWNAKDDSGMIRLDAKDGGLAPGQYVVFYDPDTAECYGSGIISERHWAKFLQDEDGVQTRDEMATMEC